MLSNDKKVKDSAFYLSMVEYVKQHSSLPNWFSSKQARNYHIKPLISDGVLIKKGYATWGINWDKFMEFSRKRSKKNDETNDKQVKKNRGGSGVGILANPIIRGHGYQFTLSQPNKINDWGKILSKSSIPFQLSAGYHQARILGNKVRFYKDIIHICYPKHKSFYAQDAQSSENQALYHFKRVLSLLESRLRMKLRAGKEYRFSVDKAHYAEIENDLAKQLNQDKEKLKVVDSEGKTWLLADFSDSINELETVHAQKSKEDMQNIVSRFMNDLREFYDKTGEVILPSDTLKMIQQLMQSHAYVAKNYESHVSAIQQLAETNKQLAHGVQLLNAREQKFKDAQAKKEQRKINDYEMQIHR